MTVLEALRRVTESIKAWTEKKITTQTVTATSDDGIAYTATVSGIETLTVGASFIMIPATVSQITTPTLNVNALGAKPVRRRLSSLPTSLQAGYHASWLTANKPFRMFYDGTAWIVEDQTKPAAADLSGTVPKANADGNGNVIADTYATKTELNQYFPKSTTITLSAANWAGSANPYSQVVTISSATENSKVDLQPTAAQTVELQNAEIALMTENNAGTITVYALGGKPTSDYEMQVLITEVTPV